MVRRRRRCQGHRRAGPAAGDEAAILMAEAGDAAVDRLIALMARLPGLGPRSARRAVLAMVRRREVLLEPLAPALAEVAATVGNARAAATSRPGNSARSAPTRARHRRDLRRRDGGRPLGDGAGRGVSRAVSRARRGPVGARRGWGRTRCASRSWWRGWRRRRARGDPGAQRDDRRPDDGALHRRPSWRRSGWRSPRLPRACRSAASSTISTTARSARR